MLHPVGQLLFLPSQKYTADVDHFSCTYTKASRCERSSRELLSGMRHFFFSDYFRKDTYFLPLPIHQRHVRVANQLV